MAYLFKIKYENKLRRLKLQKNDLGVEKLSFAHLETQIRKLFRLPSSAQLSVTYTDEEDDVVTMENDQDLEDALLEQSLNPLRIYVILVNSKNSSSPTVETEKPVEAHHAKLPMENLPPSSAPEYYFNQLLQSYDPWLKCMAFPAEIPSNSATPAALAENFFHTMASVRNGGVRSSAAAADPAAAPPPPPPEFGPMYTVHQSPSLPGAAGHSWLFEGADAGIHAQDTTIHDGVTCDVCGVSPIVGDRWKSNEKFDYDLCSSCFEYHGCEAAYTKIEQPKFRPRHFYGFQRMGQPPNVHDDRPLGMRGPYGPGEPYRYDPMTRPLFDMDLLDGVKLNARIVCNVTMFDGTEVAPGTQFTKIWRLRNSGSIPWPAHTRLEHAAGDKLGHTTMVPLEIPEQGLAPEAEMEASVDLVAPEKPGHYVSHWRLAAPAGPKFGNVLSVVVQVVPKETLDQPAEIVTADGPEFAEFLDLKAHAQAIAEFQKNALAGQQRELRFGNVEDSKTPCSRVARLQAMTEFEKNALAAKVRKLRFVKVEDSKTPCSRAAAEQKGQLAQMGFPSMFAHCDYAGLYSTAAATSDNAATRTAAEESAAGTPEAGQKATRNAALVNPFVKSAAEESAAGTHEARQKATGYAALFNPFDKSAAEESAAGTHEAGQKETEDAALLKPFVKLGAEEETKVEAPTTVSENEASSPAVAEEGNISYPVLEETRDQGPVTYPVVIDPAAAAAVTDAKPASGGEEDLSTTTAVLGKLETMGFTDSKLNLELLQKNGLDLRKTLDDLCAAEEWDYILEELEEMGFYDTDMNRRLLFKNNGSVKRVVKELVQMYRDPQGKRETVE